ncbi:50S ribosomal protein L4, chloroplastic isoform B [Glycine soja]|uniref:50S ribosomal protein L4, chloroplastic isoform B n=1 Tax=Glycine soja TaxID=3848 RepID=A0A445LA67_GLYSO|nr:50S ribosomal protein L4, chloroplastic isoform B [Glycine soja]
MELHSLLKGSENGLPSVKGEWIELMSYFGIWKFKIFVPTLPSLSLLSLPPPPAACKFFSSDQLFHETHLVIPTNPFVVHNSVQ